MSVDITDRIYVGPKIAFWVLGRYHAERVTPQEPYIVISVTDPQAAEVALPASPLCLDILRLRFHDKGNRVGALGGRVIIGEPEALSIIAFAEKHLADAKVVVCQCEAGLSRSAAIAAALSRIVQQEDRFFFQRFAPNTWVYETILESHQTLHRQEP